jgi:hypothetical protein
LLKNVDESIVAEPIQRYIARNSHEVIKMVQAYHDKNYKMANDICMGVFHRMIKTPSTGSLGSMLFG